MDIMWLLKNGQNPEQLAMSLLEQQAQSNPMMANLLNLAKQGNGTQIEQIARNLVGENYDKEFASFKSLLGLK